MSQHELDYDGSNEPDYVPACSMAIFLAGHPSYSHLDPRVTPPLGDTAHTKAFAPNIGASLKAVHPSLAIFSA
jgi:hypothetical protein